MIRLPRTIRLDPSDTFVFERPAEPGEWAVPGSFLFFDEDIAAFEGKRRAAFRAGFAGVRTLGHSTLVTVAEASEAERDDAVEALAGHIRERFGAPSREVARDAAREEIAVAASLCDHPVGTLIALHRTLEEGAIRECFRTLHAREPGVAGADRLHAHARAFEFVATDEPEERADLLGLLGARGR
jgi:Family of unknown function (DUF6505)